MKKILVTILILMVNVFAIRHNPTGYQVIVSENGSNNLAITSNGALFTSNVQGKYTSNGWLIISNAGAKLTAEGYQITSNIAVINANVVASNLTVSSSITNICPVGVTNIGYFYVIVTNMIGVSNTENPFRVMATNDVSIFGRVGITNIPAVTQSANWFVNVSNSVPVIVSNTINANITGPLDPASGAVHTIDHLLNEVHEGEMFRSTIYTVNLAANALTGGVIKTSASKVAHVYINVNMYGSSTLFVYQTPVRTNGVLATNAAFNLNTCSTNTQSLVNLLNFPANITNYGTLRNKVFIPGGAGANGRTSASYQTSIELIVCTNYEILYLLSNQSGQASDASMELFWHEETP